MFSVVFDVKVTKNKDTIEISRINGKDIGNFITNYWSTSVLEKYMFKAITGGLLGRMEFYNFFLIDVIYMMEQLSKKRNRYIPAKTLFEISEKLKSETWYKDVKEDKPGERLNFKLLDKFKYTPKPFQQEFFEYYNKVPDQYHLNGALLNGAPGSGKTFMSIATMTLAEMDRIIVVCPKNALQNVWYDDIHEFMVDPPKIWTSAMNTDPDGDTKIFVYHYEALEKAFIHHKGYFEQFRYGLILDESHNLNDIKSQRTQRWLELVKMSKSINVIHASGTPLKAIGSESIPLFRAIDPLFTPIAEERFKKIYGQSASKGLDILKNRLGLVSHVIEKEELGLDKPKMIMLPIKCKDSERYTLPMVKEAMRVFLEERVKYYKSREDQDKKFYNDCLTIHEDKIKNNGKAIQAFKLYKEYVNRIQKVQDLSLLKVETVYCREYERKDISASLPKEMVKDFRDVCSVIKYLTLKIQGECLGRVVGQLRVNASVAMCENIPFREIAQSTKKKTVVFTSFVEVLEKAKQKCIDDNLNPTVIYGKTNNNLSGLVKQFGEDSKVNPLIATYNSLSTAVPLVMADTMIMINAPFRAYIQEQAISRIHRLKQDSQTVIYQCYLDTGNISNISQRSLDIMAWSQKQVEEMTGVKSPYTLDEAEDGSVTISNEMLGFNEIITLEPRVVIDNALKCEYKRSGW